MSAYCGDPNCEECQFTHVVPMNQEELSITINVESYQDMIDEIVALIVKQHQCIHCGKEQT